jgi:hypothetical protein
MMALTELIALILGLGILAALYLLVVRRRQPRDIRRRVYERQEGRCRDCGQAMEEGWLKLDQPPGREPELVCSVCHMSRHA